MRHRAPDDIVQVRTTMIDGEPWFVGADILVALYGTTSANAHRYAALAEDERTKMARDHFGMLPGKHLILVSESGLYR